MRKKYEFSLNKVAQNAKKNYNTIQKLKIGGTYDESIS